MQQQFKFRAHLGPVIVAETVDRLVSAGIDAHAGTEHAYGTVQADSRPEAIEALNHAAGFGMARWSEVWPS